MRIDARDERCGIQLGRTALVKDITLGKIVIGNELHIATRKAEPQNFGRSQGTFTSDSNT